MSPILPVTGLSLGLLSHLLQRGAVPAKQRRQDLLKRVLMGGLISTGAEIARVGGARLYSDFNRTNSIPRGLQGVVIPHSLDARSGWFNWGE